MGAAGRRFCTAGASYFNVYVGLGRGGTFLNPRRDYPHLRPFRAIGELIRCR